MDKGSHDISNELAEMLDDDELKTAAMRLQKNRAKEVAHTLRIIETSTPQKAESDKTESEVVSIEPTVEPVLDETISRKPKKAKRPKPNDSTKEFTWSRPTAILNTRIPPEADDLLDELLQARRAEWKSKGRVGNEPTKQILVLEGLSLLFQRKKQSLTVSGAESKDSSIP